MANPNLLRRAGLTNLEIGFTDEEVTRKSYEFIGKCSGWIDIKVPSKTAGKELNKKKNCHWSIRMTEKEHKPDNCPVCGYSLHWTRAVVG